MLDCQRALFSLPDGQHYLNCAYMSPLLKTAEAAGIAGLQRKAVPADITAEDFFEPAENLRRTFARLIQTSPERIALIPAVSYGVAIASHNLPLDASCNVVVPAEEFPSLVYPWLEQYKHTGATLRLIERPNPAPSAQRSTVDGWNARILDAIDTHTAAVVLSSVHWTDGTPFALDAIGDRARDVGAAFIVDGTQSVGALPFDFDRLQPDLLVCAGYKWLLGPYQSGFAAVGDRFLDGRPFEHNWINRKNSRDFSALTHYQAAYRGGARRFDVGEHANLILMPMLQAGLDRLHAWGVPHVQRYCARLADDLARALADTPYHLAPAEERTDHLFGVPIADPERIPALLAQLRRREVYVSQRGDSIRVSPHVYNTAADIAALAEALGAAAA